MNYYFPNGESLVDLSTPSVAALWLSGLIVEHYGYNTITITYVRNGVHIENSLHYVGDALDIRTRDWPDVQPLVRDIRRLLPPVFDVILESDHLHIEFDPRPGKLTEV